MPFRQARWAGLKTGLIFIFGWRPSSIGAVSQHWLYWEANSMSHLNKLLRQLKSVIDNFFGLLMKKWRKSKKNGFFGGLLKSIFLPLWAVFRKKLWNNKSWVIRCRKLPFLKFFIYLSSKLRYWASRLDANQKWK